MTAPAPTPRHDDGDPNHTPSPRTTPLGKVVIGAAIVFGLVCGAFEITNTSIGWHIASGRWMLEHREVLDRDVFSFTSGGVEWIDHEWLFQILAAALFDLGGAPLLVVLRMAVIAALTVVLLRIGTSSGLDPPVALVLAALCVTAARPRFFLRPELATLLLLTVAMWLFADRRGRRWWPLPLAAVIVLGVNLHGAMLVAPILITVWFAGEVADQLIRSAPDRPALGSGLAGVVAAFLAPILNPQGWQIWTVPFRLAEMVRQPHIPNPEWIAPGFVDAPALYIALVLTAVVLAARRAAPQQWLTAAATALLALRHIRNIGLFFVLLPQSLAPALAGWPWFAADTNGDRPSPRARTALCLALVAVLGMAAALRPWPRAGFDFAADWYPDRALRFLDAHSLLDGPLYNDVRFGGWLILTGAPERRVFLDDRNEIHEPLLEEIWKILSRSDVAAWEDLLERWQIDAVLLRYHEPISVATPDGRDLGRRGFSQLWFPSQRWAMVYWDDVAMVLVRRSSVPESLIAAREYRVVHPDDLEHLTAALEDDPSLRRRAETELHRALADDPGSRRAGDLLEFVTTLDR